VGKFDKNLAGFRETLMAIPPDMPVLKALHEAIVEFNRFDDAVMGQHRERMVLILRAPEFMRI
jgi:hypothetical protein